MRTYNSMRHTLEGEDTPHTKSDFLTHPSLHQLAKYDMFIFLLPVEEPGAVIIFPTSSSGTPKTLLSSLVLPIAYILYSQRLAHTPLYLKFPFLWPSKSTLLLRVYFKSNLLSNRQHAHTLPFLGDPLTHPARSDFSFV